MLTFLCINLYGQTIEEVKTTDTGIAEFIKQAKSDKPDYNLALKLLTAEVKSNPQNAEERYFLGYVIDRMGANDGETMIDQNLDATIKSSEQFEEVNRLEPTYKEQIFILDPYSKIGSIWGSLAESYRYKNLEDSARWALQQGKKRGGFLEPMLEVQRQILKNCEQNAIYINSGDNNTFSIWYLQNIEKLRTDITFVQAELLGTKWFPKYLKKQFRLRMALSDIELDTINYQRWDAHALETTNSNVTARHSSWIQKPTYDSAYILRGDRVLIDIIQQNYETRPIYFGLGLDTSSNLCLDPYFVPDGLVYRLKLDTLNSERSCCYVSSNLWKYNIDNIRAEDILKSKDAIYMVNLFRFAYYYTIDNLRTQGDFKDAIELVEYFKKKFPKEKMPYSSKLYENFFEQYFKSIDNNY